MRIISLEVDNVMRLKAVRIKPDGGMVVIGGKNEQGKSSVLNSIEMALGGKKALPPKPVREGAEEAYIVCELDTMTIRRVIDPDGKTSLTVESKDGAQYRKPQAMLDELVGALSFDPLGFTRMDTKVKLNVLRELVGLDFTAQDEERGDAFSERTDVNRETKRLGGQLDRLTHHDGLPSESVSMVELAAAVEKAQDAHRAHARMQEKARECERAVWDADAHADKLKAQLKELQAKLKDHDQKCVLLQDEASAAGNEAHKHKEADLPDIEAARARLNESEETNDKIRENAEHATATESLKESVAKADELTARIAEIDAAKVDAVTGAKFPVKGLSLTDEGVVFNGIPFEQASGAQQLRVSVAIGLAMNPKLPVLLVRDGSLLDEESLKLLGELAEEADAQVWVERVSEGDECSLIIEDGEVKS